MAALMTTLDFSGEQDPENIPIGHPIPNHEGLYLYASAEIVTSRAKTILERLAFPVRLLPDRTYIKYTTENDVVWREGDDYFIGRVKLKDWTP